MHTLIFLKLGRFIRITTNKDKQNYSKKEEYGRKEKRPLLESFHKEKHSCGESILKGEYSLACHCEPDVSPAKQSTISN